MSDADPISFARWQQFASDVPLGQSFQCLRNCFQSMACGNASMPTIRALTPLFHGNINPYGQFCDRGHENED